MAPEKLHVRKVNRIPRTGRLQGRACRRRGGERAGAGARCSAGDAPARLEAGAAPTRPLLLNPGAHEAPASGFCPGGLSLASRSPHACTHSREEPCARLRPRPGAPPRGGGGGQARFAAPPRAPQASRRRGPACPVSSLPPRRADVGRWACCGGHARVAGKSAGRREVETSAKRGNGLLRGPAPSAGRSAEMRGARGEAAWRPGLGPEA